MDMGNYPRLFVYEKTSVYRDEPIYVSYKAKKGIVSDAVVESPWL